MLITSRPTIGSLCSGYGGLEIAVAEAFGAEPAWFAETNGEAALVFAAHNPGVPNLGDLIRIDWEQTARTSVIAAGFPCQTVSNIGRRLGDEDPRWLWPHVRRGLDAHRPDLIVLENVDGLVSWGEGRLWRGILEDLEARHYAVTWGIFGACLPAVQGVHHRHRVFLLGRRLDDGSTQPALQHKGKRCDRSLSLLPTPRAVDGSRGPASPEYWDRALAAGRKNGMDLEPAVLRHAAGSTRFEAAVRRWEKRSRPAPVPTMIGNNGSVRMRAEFAEWMFGLDEGHVTAHVSREAALRIIGNGVFPRQAISALRTLGAGRMLDLTSPVFEVAA